ncbi:MAG: sigma-70 family RNA polymerase sigma factor [Saprospiraceae bacterium]|nr:sigma-70 family RNA polymerase sigma factor [Saprospiraceae bacterium]MCB0625635.1 sigma-70 family RNA polymerase sigma factor [Saprospiraceae bacterium]MCB0677130.1 sigma-70 family RNA polymerase sigma factor [Saprospiraceae bacterium]MCB0681518.1 sigma-70 family RNA polymerase sigma factor [Saprospiraceae bacterium]
MEGSSHSDWKYIQGLLDNDRVILEKCYDQFENSIIQFARRNNGNIEDGRDLFQEGLLAVLKMAQRPNFQLTSSFYALLFGICRRIWLKQLRKRYGREVTISDENEYTDEQDVERTLLARELSMLVRNKLQELTERCQKILNLFYEEERKMQEIAEEMEFANENVAKKEKFKCKKRLIELIQSDPTFDEY